MRGGELCWDRGIRTWSAELAVLLLLTGIHIHARLVEGEREEVVQAGGGARHGVQPLQPLLALLKGGELTPGGTGQNNSFINVTLAVAAVTHLRHDTRH